MKHFIYKIIIFILCFICFSGLMVLFDWLVIGPQNLGGYQASLIDKVERLKSIDEPKIILIGNSNLSFGINSELLEREIGMPVVNMGLHAGLGNAFLEEMAKLHLSEGDIVILCHTTYSDDGKMLEPALAPITLENHRNLWKLVRFTDYFDIARAYPDYIKDAFIVWLGLSGDNIENTTLSYSRNSFNKYGDVVLRNDNIYNGFAEGSITVPQINDTCTIRINKLNSYVNDHNATLLVAGYPIASGKYTPDMKEFSDFGKRLQEKLECEVISDFSDYLIPYEYFYDTPFHLTQSGADVRTQQLIKDLNQWFERNNLNG